ncbi:hypothetical protein AAEP93_004825 [Penicillium crustosum]
MCQIFAQSFTTVPTVQFKLQKSPGHAEIAAFKTLQSAQSHVAPRLLALREDAQGNDGLIPVPGKPITKEEFWGLHPSLRDTIRGKFKILYSPLQARLYSTPLYSKKRQLL